MTSAVGGIGSNPFANGNDRASFKDQPFYQKYYNMYLESGSKLTFEKWLRDTDNYGKFIQQLENWLETGDYNHGDNSTDSLSSTRYVSNGGSAIYQSEDDETMYQFDWATGEVILLDSAEEQASALGLSDVNFDIIKLGRNSAQVIDYTDGNNEAGLTDGQQTNPFTVSGGPFSGIKYVQQEFDMHYIFEDELRNPDDPEYGKAYNIYMQLVYTAEQWIKPKEGIATPEEAADDLKELKEIEAQYGINSQQYLDYIEKLIVKYIYDNDWDSMHTHKKYDPNSNVSLTPDDSVDGTDGADGTDGTGSTGGTNGTGETTNPNDISGAYDKSEIIDSIENLPGLYSSGTWYGNLVTWAACNRNKSQGHDMATNIAANQAHSILTSLESALIAQLGDKYTDDIGKYIKQVKTEMLSDNNKWNYIGYYWKKGCGKNNKGYVPTCNVKKLVDDFFTKVDALCKNNGKTNEEVDAEKQAEYEEKSKNAAGYQNLLNDLKYETQWTHSELGLESEHKYPSVDYLSNEDVTQRFITPLIQKIIEAYKGQIPEADLKILLDNATNTTMNRQHEWASYEQLGNGFYNITVVVSDLIRIFKEEVKDLIENNKLNVLPEEPTYSTSGGNGTKTPPAKINTVGDTSTGEYIYIGNNQYWIDYETDWVYYISGDPTNMHAPPQGNGDTGEGYWAWSGSTNDWYWIDTQTSNF